MCCDIVVTGFGQCFTVFTQRSFILNQICVYVHLSCELQKCNLRFPPENVIIPSAIGASPHPGTWRQHCFYFDFKSFPPSPKYVNTSAMKPVNISIKATASPEMLSALE